MQSISIAPGQWFSDVIPEFNTQTIYNKWITGVGGTTKAIQDGNTIIISPNVSGILSKLDIPNVIGVYAGVTPMDITSKLQHILELHLQPAFISTPDSFWKIYDAVGKDIYINYQCIIDEIHCFQEAASYRDSLPAFIEHHFVKFVHKSVITATYTPLSHPIFKNWETVQLIPRHPIYKRHRTLLFSITPLLLYC